MPAALGFVIGAVIGWIVTRLTCLPEGCPGWQLAAALLTGLGAAIGILIVAVLAVRSYEEWKAMDPPDDNR